jgi:calcium-dependent protein kinase
MEYCGGGDLFSRLSQHFKKLTEGTAREIMKKLFSAVNHCHSNNIAHRDLKPENIMFVTPFTD